MFPSLSGKTFIRTPRRHRRGCKWTKSVSIPFREDLHSDEIRFLCRELYNSLRFHPFQGRPSFGLLVRLRQPANIVLWFPSLSGKTFIRTSKQRRTSCTHSLLRFHPFQGRPSFGLRCHVNSLEGTSWSVSIPFREDLHSDRSFGRS